MPETDVTHPVTPDSVDAAPPTDSGGEHADAGPVDGLDLKFLERIAPVFKRIRTYSRLRVDGLDHVPASGPAILVGNHTGWLGLDYVFTALSVFDGYDRVVRGMAHSAWFANPATASFARKAGIIEISKTAMRERLDAGDLVMMFPEGEKGAFKPGRDYVLEEFARGFVRVAAETGVPVIPVCILGGEEANPVGTRIESYEELVKMRGGLPIPKNLVPKPVKWRIKFLPPLDLHALTPADAADSDRMHDVAEATRTLMQREIRKMKVERGNPYL